MSGTVKGLRVVVGIEVDASLNGVSKLAFVDGLQSRLDAAVGNGLLTGDSAVEVEGWSVRIDPLTGEEASLSEAQVEAWFRGQLESGAVCAEEIPRMLARYALSTAEASRAELAERMCVE